MRVNQVINKVAIEHIGIGVADVIDIDTVKSNRAAEVQQGQSQIVGDALAYGGVANQIKRLFDFRSLGLK